MATLSFESQITKHRTLQLTAKGIENAFSAYTVALERSGDQREGRKM